MVRVAAVKYLVLHDDLFLPLGNPTHFGSALVIVYGEDSNESIA